MQVCMIMAHDDKHECIHAHNAEISRACFEGRRMVSNFRRSGKVTILAFSEMLFKPCGANVCFLAWKCMQKGRGGE